MTGSYESGPTVPILMVPPCLAPPLAADLPLVDVPELDFLLPPPHAASAKHPNTSKGRTSQRPTFMRDSPSTIASKWRAGAYTARSSRAPVQAPCQPGVT